MRYLFETLGCRCNQFETAAMETELKRRGHEIVAENADVVVINGCAVTAESTRKSRQAARRLLKKNPGAKLAVCGCWPQAESAEALALEPALVGGSGKRGEFVEALCRLGEGTVNLLDAPRERTCFEPLPPARLEGRTRAFLKLEDGCENYCAYCIIPFLRGRVRSLPPEQLREQVEALRESGIRELILTGIELASYEYGLENAVMQIAALAPELRIRIGSLEPRVITEEFCRKLSAVSGFCPHFHLSLQSGCDETLLRMGRRYNTAEFAESVRLLRQYFPNCNLSCDLITGFPGETEEEFEQTLRFVRDCRFAHCHVFPYSERRGTRATLMEGSVPKAVREHRAQRVIAETAEDEAAFLRAQVGSVCEVLFESRVGRTPNDCETELFPGMEGQIRCVKIIGVKNGKLMIDSEY